MNNKNLYICLTISLIALLITSLKLKSIFWSSMVILIIDMLITELRADKDENFMEQISNSIKEHGSVVDPECMGVKTRNIYITAHAQKRMASRLKCKPEKYKKIVKKAWKSKDEMSQALKLKLINSKSARGDDEYRYYLGYVFVFRDEEKNGKLVKKLITLFNPKQLN